MTSIDPLYLPLESDREAGAVHAALISASYSARDEARACNELALADTSASATMRRAADDAVARANTYLLLAERVTYAMTALGWQPPAGAACPVCGAPATAEGCTVEIGHDSAEVQA